MYAGIVRATEVCRVNLGLRAAARLDYGTFAQQLFTLLGPSLVNLELPFWGRHFIWTSL